MTGITEKDINKSVVQLFLLTFIMSSYAFKVDLIGSDLKDSSLMMNKKVIRYSPIDFSQDLKENIKIHSKFFSKRMPLKLVETKVYMKTSPVTRSTLAPVVTKVTPLTPLVVPPILTPFRLTPVALENIQRLTKKNQLYAVKSRNNIIEKLQELKKLGSISFAEYVRLKKLFYN